MRPERRDNRNRILVTGETQRNDGRYVYRYIDTDGIRREISSWRLVGSDVTPEGKEERQALRDLEKEIRERIDRENAIAGDSPTVLVTVRRYIRTKQGVRATTRLNYETVYNWLKKDPFRKRKISTVSESDAQNLLKRLKEEGKGAASVRAIGNILRSAFEKAVDDHLTAVNPFAFLNITGLAESFPPEHEALSKADEERFLDYVKGSPHYQQYYEGMYILFHTGMKISEFCGLTVHDVDMEAGTISIARQMIDTGSNIYIQVIKPGAQNRLLPMTDGVFECFSNLLLRDRPEKEPEIDGYSGFLCLNSLGRPMTPYGWKDHFKKAVANYNCTHVEKLPAITTRTCRNTYARKMVMEGMEPERLRYLLGYSRVDETRFFCNHIRIKTAAEAETAEESDLLS